MTAKEQQAEFIKAYLKPTLKQHGYQTTRQTWWKNQGDFFIIIHLQNFSWNSKDSVDFCFNIGIGATATLIDPAKRKAEYNDLTIHVREGFYLPESRKQHKYRQNNGYAIKSDADPEDFKKEMGHDFENEILPRLAGLKTLKDCLNYYESVTSGVNYLRRVMAENNLS